MENRQKRLLIFLLTIGVLFSSYPAFTNYLTEGRDTAGFIGILSRLHLNTTMTILMIKLIQIGLQALSAITGFFWFWTLTDEKETAGWLAFLYTVSWTKMALVLGQYELMEGLELALLPLLAMTAVWAVRNRKIWLVILETVGSIGWLLVTRHIVPWYNKEWLISIVYLFALSCVACVLRRKQIKISAEIRMLIGFLLMAAGVLTTVMLGTHLTDVPVYLIALK